MYGWYFGMTSFEVGSCLCFGVAYMAAMPMRDSGYCSTIWKAALKMILNWNPFSESSSTCEQTAR